MRFSLPLKNGLWFLLLFILLRDKPATAAPMTLKYQSDITALGLSIGCPSEVTEPDNTEAYRWVYEPIGDHRNFLPNVAFDRVTGSSVNYQKMTEGKKCSRCGMSLYTSLDYAKGAWKHLTESIGEKLKLDYTHVACGTLEKGDGLMKEPKAGHFGFYESDMADLKTKFAIVDTLA